MDAVSTPRRRAELLAFRAINSLGIGFRINAFNLYNGFLHRRHERYRQSSEAKSCLPAPLMRIPKERGIIAISRGVLPHTDEALSAADALVREDRQNPVQAQKKEYLRDILRPDSLHRFPEILRFAASPEIISIVTDYLGEVPVLSEIMLWVSEDPSLLERGSQMYHRDTADKTQVKFFFNLSDVGPQNGPLNVIPRHVSQQVSKEIGYWTNKCPYYVPDQMMFAKTDPSVAVTCTGERGSGYFVDTSQCFHFGSRSPTEPRMVLMLQYTRLGRGDLRGQDFRRHRNIANHPASNMLLDANYLPAGG